MSDERVRAAERRWRESGAIEDEAALLRERLRAGPLAASRLRWAAACGHAAAGAVIGGRLPEDLTALQAELDDPAAEARFWLAVIRAGWVALRDDRFLFHLWVFERAFFGLPWPSYTENVYDTLASDLLLPIEELLGAACARMRGVEPTFELP